MSADSTRQQLLSLNLENVIVTRQRDLVDGFKVRKALPSARGRIVGPFIFLDQTGPEVLRGGRRLDVAPQPDAPWRRASRWSTSYLVEFRLEFEGADRAGERRLEREAICAGYRRDGVYPAAGIWTSGCALSLNDNLTERIASVTSSMKE